jgi:hypothetical protein
MLMLYDGETSADWGLMDSMINIKEGDIVDCYSIQVKQGEL